MRGTLTLQRDCGGLRGESKPSVSTDALQVSSSPVLGPVCWGVLARRNAQQEFAEEEDLAQVYKSLYPSPGFLRGQ